MGKIEYFAYGSNMNPERMKKRIGWQPPLRSAVLEDYQLLFDKVSNNGGKANIRPLKGEKVEGVLYQVEAKDLLSLDGFEGVSGGHYARVRLVVNILGEDECIATAYIALKTGPENPPTREYLDHLLAGAEYLSTEYLSKLQDRSTLD